MNNMERKVVKIKTSEDTTKSVILGTIMQIFRIVSMVTNEEFVIQIEKETEIFAKVFRKLVQKNQISYVKLLAAKEFAKKNILSNLNISYLEKQLDSKECNIVEIRTKNAVAQDVILSVISEITSIISIEKDFIVEIDKDSEMFVKVFRDLVASNQISNIEISALEILEKQPALEDLIGNKKVIVVKEENKESVNSNTQLHKKNVKETNETVKQKVEQESKDAKEQESKIKNKEHLNLNDKIELEWEYEKAANLFKRGWQMSTIETSEKLGITYEQAMKIIMKLEESGIIIQSKPGLYEIRKNNSKSVTQNKTENLVNTITNIFDEQKCMPILDYIMNESNFEKSVLNKKFDNVIALNVVNVLVKKGYIEKRTDMLMPTYKVILNARIKYWISKKAGIAEDELIEKLNSSKTKILQALENMVQENEISCKEQKYYLEKEM